MYPLNKINVLCAFIYNHHEACLLLYFLFPLFKTRKFVINIFIHILLNFTLYMYIFLKAIPKIYMACFLNIL